GRTFPGFSNPSRMLILAFALLAMPAVAQWMNYPTPGVPRTKDGKPNLSAPAPRTREGKPDFSGLWRAPGYSTRYLENLAADGVEVPMRPWAERSEEHT